MSEPELRPKKKREKKPPKERRKMMFRFWLDQYRPEDVKPGQYLYMLRERKDGSYTRTIRNSIRLFATLEQGDVKVLLELFPHIQALLNNHYMGGGQ